MLSIMNSKRFFRTGIVIALAAVSAVSCVTNRKIAYLQDMKHGTQIELEDKFEAVISPYDELDVIITSFDTELARPFNLRIVQRPVLLILSINMEILSFRSWEPSQLPVLPG